VVTEGTAWTRALSPRIGACALTHLDRNPIDLARAIDEHEAYERALAAVGLDIVRLPALPDAPDGVFVEDTAILLGEHAVITRPGAASRAEETETTAAGLAGHFTIHRLGAGTLDGGDVLRIGDTLHVGLSGRTSRAGIQALGDLAGLFGYRVVPVKTRGCLHLKTAATFIGADAAGTPVLLHHNDWVSPSHFEGIEPVAVAEGEAAAANALRVGDTLLIAAGNPRTAELLAARGFAIVEVDNRELQKAEAGLTCCSLIAEAGWLRSKLPRSS
jgi:dimethylargininase